MMTLEELRPQGRAALAKLRGKYTSEDCEKAAAFYRQSPDGQYDELAEYAIIAYLYQRLLDDSVRR